MCLHGWACPLSPVLNTLICPRVVNWPQENTKLNTEQPGTDLSRIAAYGQAPPNFDQLLHPHGREPYACLLCNWAWFALLLSITVVLVDWYRRDNGIVVYFNRRPYILDLQNIFKLKKWVHFQRKTIPCHHIICLAMCPILSLLESQCPWGMCLLSRSDSRGLESWRVTVRRDCGSICLCPHWGSL